MTIDRDDLDRPSCPRATEPVPEPLPSAQRRREKLRERLRREGLFVAARNDDRPDARSAAISGAE
jgi:hypothetical protein